MSADNGIFIFQTPEGKFAVVDHTMSDMPMEIPNILKTGSTCYGEQVQLSDRLEGAWGVAQTIRAGYRARNDILEYGIVDWSSDTYEQLMAPYALHTG